MSVFLKTNWENIIMANYAIEPELLQPFLPAGVELDLYNNKAWVSLVGFMFKNTKLFNIPIPWLGTFEEINLRFYVKRKDGDTIKRGVVFINETVPYKAVAYMAKKLYKEHYSAVKTRHRINISATNKHICYEWLNNKDWQCIVVKADNESKLMQQGSFEEFIYEHYWGYTKINETTSEEYAFIHPRWQVNTIQQYTIECNFQGMYGSRFSCLNNAKPNAVFLAQGSVVTVDWKRTKLTV
jgi:uncharacterized protein